MKPKERTFAADRVLFVIKTKGPQTADAIAKRLGVTGMAVRQHLQQLLADGMVEIEEVRKGVGRPSQVWHLTAKSRARFPDSHAGLALSMINAVRSAYGEEGMAKLLESRTRQMTKDYGERVESAGRALSHRAKALADARSDEGYMAEVIKIKDGAVMLVENHCPICAAAEQCSGLCASELDVFRKVLGPDVSIERTEHIILGGRRCAYTIEPKR